MADKEVQLGVVVNADGVEAGIAKGKRALKDFGAAAQQAGKDASAGLSGAADGSQATAAKVDAATKSLIRSIERVTTATEYGGRSTRQYFELLATQKGVNADALKPYLAALDAANAKQAAANPLLQASTNAFNQYGLSAKQTAAALRQVPAQLTDIFVSLQGGQAPLTVLLQQGGQLKDIFGGIAPAARALGSAVLRLVNPFTVAGAAVAALAFAYNKGTSESDAYAKALILSGNAAGVSVRQLNALAESVARNVGTQAQAADALAQLASTGQIGAASLGKVAEAAVRLERVGGQAVADTVKEFAALGKDPVEAAIKLNEKYNFLTLSVLEQIRALDRQGKTAEAAALAQSTYADAALGRTKELEDRLGNVEFLWRKVKDAALGAADSLVGLFRPESTSDVVKGIERQIAQLRAAGQDKPVFFGESVAQLEARKNAILAGARAEEEAAAGRKKFADAQKAGFDAEQAILRIREQSRTKQQQLNDELKKYRDGIEAVRRANPQSALLDPLKIAADEASIRAKFKERGPSVSAVRDDAATRLLQTLRETEATVRAQLSVDEKLTASERQRAKFEQEIADLKEKRVLTADQKSLLAAQDTIRAQLDKNVAVEKELEAREKNTRELERQRKELERFQEVSAQLSQSIDSANAGRREQFDATLQVFGRGSEQRERVQSQIAIQREFQRFRERLDRSTPKDLIGGDLYNAEVEKIKAALADALVATDRYYEDLGRMQADWSTGATRAFEDYVSVAQNTSALTEQFLSRSFQGMEDSLVRFITTGKLSFTDLANSIVADITRIIVKQQIMIPLLQALGLGKDGGLDGFLGSLFGAPGRASGGPVSANNVYRVTERGPEVLDVGGRQYLMMGNQGGDVRPATQQAARSSSVVIHQSFAPGTDRKTVEQAAAFAGRRVQQSLARGTA